MASWPKKGSQALPRLLRVKPNILDLQLRCIIDGDTTTILVSIPGDKDISMLAQRIHDGGKRVLHGIDSKDLILFKVRNVFSSGIRILILNYYAIMFDQVQINLEKHNDDSLKSLATSPEIDHAEKLEPDWATVSQYWKAQPPPSMLSIFVKIRPAGEQKLVAVNVTLLITIHASAIRFLPVPVYRATIVPVDDGEFRNPIDVEVPNSPRVHEFQDVIYAGLQQHGVVGRNFDTGLMILPLQEMPSLAELQKTDLTGLHSLALAPSKLPNEKASEFFRRENSELNRVHFLVWLPPVDGGFHWLNPFNT